MIRSIEEVTEAWLSAVLGVDVASLESSASESNWARSTRIRATMADGRTQKFWLKLCLGDTFGRSEVDFYVLDYVDLKDAPLVKCHAATFEEGHGYFLLLDDLSDEYEDRKTRPPTLEYGLELAEALARLHGHYWETGAIATSGNWDRYFAQIEPGIGPLEQVTGLEIRRRFVRHADKLRERWDHPSGQTLLHGDVNPTNVLTPKDAEVPVRILDRQPFNWSLTYGLAVYDLAYAIVPWWPYEFRITHQEAILRSWFEQLGQTGYSWEQAQADWELSVEQCLHIPIQWCREPLEMEQMQGLWRWQLGNITGLNCS